MNKIQRLLQEHCPNGVEWTYIGDSRFIEIADNNRKPVKSSNRTMGNNPYYGANNIQDYVDGYTHDGTYILVAEDGSASIKNYSIQWATGKFWANNHVHILRGIDGIDSRFMFHYLHTVNFTPFLTGGERAKLTKGKLLEIPIPLPPLPVQQEIVRILDKFTTLEAELEAELEARKKQYEYYKDNLLTFGDEAEWKALGEVGAFVRGSGLQKIDLTTSGIPAIHYGQIYTYYGVSVEQTISFVTPKTANGLKKVDYGDVIITNTSENLEDVGKAVFYSVKEQGVTGGHATIFKPSKEIIGKYLVYYTQTAEFSNQKRKYAKGTKVIDVSANDLAKITVPIPYPNDTKKSLEEQARIVAILDRFDTLVNSISEGLPKEIALRRKQYEYYREQLLSFPKR